MNYVKLFLRGENLPLAISIPNPVSRADLLNDFGERRFPELHKSSP